MGFSYTANTPQPTTFPANDQPLMNANFQYLSAFGNKDHNFSSLSSNANDGYHRQVTFNTDHATTGFASGVSVAYANTANGGSQLFFNNALGDVQLTTVKTSIPTMATKGATFLPGGILMQWNTVTASLLSAPADTFLVAFSSAPWVINLTILGSPYLGTQGYPSVATKAAASFTIGNSTGVNQSYTFSYLAIGPA